jgi:hypothetical protein
MEDEDEDEEYEEPEEDEELFHAGTKLNYVKTNGSHANNGTSHYDEDLNSRNVNDLLKNDEYILMSHRSKLGGGHPLNSKVKPGQVVDNGDDDSVDVANLINQFRQLQETTANAPISNNPANQ